MPIRTPLTYLQNRRDAAHVRKPTTHAKVASYNYINPQISSPFFSRLPGEVRHLIYVFALTASLDPSRPFSKHSWYYRPGYTHARSINTNLLLVCRRVYLEADHLAIVQNEHLIFQPPAHGPPGHNSYLLPAFYSSSSASSSSNTKSCGLLKHAQREKIYQVHIFAHQLWLEDWNKEWYKYCCSWSAENHGIGPDGDLHPERLKITIRHTDWWYFMLGENSPLALDPKFTGRAPPRSWVAHDAPFMPKSWGSRFKLLKGLKVFELELETLERKKNELDEVVERAHGWKFPLQDDQVLVCDRDATQYDRWTGSKHFDGWKPNSGYANAVRRLRHRTGSSSQEESMSVASRSNSTETVTKESQHGAKKGWLRISSRSLASRRVAEEDEEILAPEDRLDYYVVTLTFRAEDAMTKIEKGVDHDEDENEGENEVTVPVNPLELMNILEDGPLHANNNNNVQPNARQGMFVPASWIPRRTGFPTAYG